MKTKFLMICSAIFMLGLGALLTFAPNELIVSTGSIPQPALELVMQATGALYLGFALLNWVAKDNLIGGIYSRPVALGNFLHFVIFALAAVKACATRVRETPLIIVAFIYVIFAVWFAVVAFGSPVKPVER